MDCLILFFLFNYSNVSEFFVKFIWDCIVCYYFDKQMFIIIRYYKKVEKDFLFSIFLILKLCIEFYYLLFYDKKKNLNVILIYKQVSDCNFKIY